jgi:hypothetical protein
LERGDEAARQERAVSSLTDRTGVPRTWHFDAKGYVSATSSEGSVVSRKFNGRALDSRILQGRPAAAEYEFVQAFREAPPLAA